jgi:hypothetical protein
LLDIVSVGSVCGIVSVVSLTGFLFRTTGTYIRRLVQQRAMHGDVIIAQIMTGILGAGFATGVTGINAFCSAKITSDTGTVVGTVIRGVTDTVYKAAMVFHLP